MVFSQTMVYQVLVLSLQIFSAKISSTQSIIHKYFTSFNNFKLSEIAGEFWD